EIGESGERRPLTQLVVDQVDPLLGHGVAATEIRELCMASPELMYGGPRTHPELNFTPTLAIVAA
ncbi:MAG: hypothetical protein JW888_02750, partial [Pirellulales bacterium]|nr:hypothetical protein [Pirellulales bacterium]